MLSTALPILAAAFVAACAAESESEPVVLGLTGPFTESYGAQMKMGAEMALKQINESGGIDGRPLVFEAQDDAAQPDRALEIARTLLENEEVLGVVGPLNSSTTIEAGPVYNQGLATVATSATSPAVSRLGEWVFRVASSDSANAVALAEVAREISDGRAAILFANDDYGRGLTRSFQSAFRDADGRVIEADPFLEDTEDFTPYLERLKRRGVGLVFLAGLDASAARIIGQAEEIGLDVRFIGGDGIERLVEMGEGYDGTVVGMLYHPEASEAAREFAEAFRAEYGREPGSEAALAFDAVHLMARAARAGNLTRAQIRDYLETVGRAGGAPPLEGATGTIQFDAQGDPTGKDVAVGILRNGRYELMEGGR